MIVPVLKGVKSDEKTGLKHLHHALVGLTIEGLDKPSKNVARAVS